VRVRIPPLRERREDVPVLFARFLDRAARRLGRDIPPIDHAIRRRLLEHDWPGNLRELSNFASEVAVGIAAPTERPVTDRSLSKQVQDYEAELIREALTAFSGDMRRVTESLQIPRKTLYDKMARHGIQPSEHRRR
jgi:two-component system C4-dicarboxylate transport response regulator DctD